MSAPAISPETPCPKCGGTNPNFHCNRFIGGMTGGGFSFTNDEQPDQSESGDRA